MTKHLVLDDDVHRELLRRKSETGLKVRDIGNAVLRALLGQSLIPDLIGRKLDDAGLLSRESFDAVWREATAEVASAVPLASDLVRKTKRDTLTAGSWEIRELLHDTEGGFQVVQAWTKDARARPFSAHRHPSTEVLIVLAGRLAITANNELHVVEAPGCFTLPPSTIHSGVPLDQDTMLLGILTPPEEGLRL